MSKAENKEELSRTANVEFITIIISCNLGIAKVLVWYEFDDLFTAPFAIDDARY